MREHKIVVLGSMGAGKSTLVRTVAGDDAVNTDVANTDIRSDKLATTVALDYADMNLPNGDRMRLYGTPGQARFEFIWPVLLQGARGIVLLVDASLDRSAEEFGGYLKVLRSHSPDVPAVVGLSKLDLCPGRDLGTYAAQLEAHGRTLPLVPVDTRNAEEILMLMDILMSEIETVDLVAVHG